MQQFYLLTGGGAFLTSMLLVGIGWIGGNLLSHFSGKQKLWVNFISLLPVTGLLILHTSLSYRLAGTIALLMCLIGWQIYLKFFLYDIAGYWVFPFYQYSICWEALSIFVCVRFSSLRVGFKYKVSKVLSSDHDYISGKLFGLGNNFFTYALDW